MSQRLRIPPAIVATLVMAVVGIGAIGCEKKLAGIDPSLSPPRYPEGVRDTLEGAPSDLVVWPDIPNPVRIEYADTTKPDEFFERYRKGEGASIGCVLDYVESTGYQMFRRESGGGFRRYLDFDLTASRRWADRNLFGSPQGSLVLPPAQLFAFTDPAPPAQTIPGYMGRAVLSGISGATSPLTNLGEVAGAVGLIGGSIDNRDSLLEVTWDPVAGAKGYWLHIFQPGNNLRTSFEAIETGLVAPVAIGKVRDLFIGYFPAAVAGYKLGDPVPTGARILFYRVLHGGNIVILRVSAVDAAGQLIATHGRDPREGSDLGAWLEENRDAGNRTLFFPLRALVVEVLVPESPSPARLAAPMGLSAVESGVPGMAYYRPAQAGSLRVFP